LLGTLVDRKIDFIVLAGFLRKIPSDVTERFAHRIINIHPALLPKFGGKGMYGGHVHNAVIQNRELESGITIHLVNDFYDEGEILFQAKCAVDKDDTPSSLAAKIHRLEHEHFAPEVEKWIIKNI
jgi:phosphoribosylglycinamide formyltransferase-1